jgi:hypothetical protein
MGYLQDNINTIIGIIIVILILCLYYGYYFIQNMIQTEIKDFYIKIEKRRLLKEKIDNNKEIALQQQNIQLQNKLQEKMIEDNFLNFQNNNINNNQNNNINNDINNEALDLDNVSFVDPIKNKKSSNNNDYANDNDYNIVNQNLAVRNFDI